MTRNFTSTALLPELAFVVQLRSLASAVPGDLRGRVEHVKSGRARSFESLGELAAFMTAIAQGGDGQGS